MKQIDFFRGKSITALILASFLIQTVHAAESVERISNNETLRPVVLSPKNVKEVLNGKTRRIPKVAQIEILKEDGSVEVTSVARDFFVTLPRKVYNGEPGPVFEEQTFEANPINLAKNGSYQRAFDYRKRVGQHVASVTLYPNVGGIPEEGTLIDIDGAYLGFRLKEEENPSYELVGLDFSKAGEEEWEIILTVSAASYPGDKLVREIRDLMTIKSGFSPNTWESKTLIVTLDYDSHTWWWGGLSEQNPRRFPLISSPDEPQLRISNGPHGETIVIHSDIRSSEQL